MYLVLILCNVGAIKCILILLHLLSQVTPVYIQEQWPSIDWYRFLCLLERLPAGARHVAATLGVCESFLAQAIQGRLPERTAEQRERLRVHRRFFTALALHDLVHEAPILYVAGKYSVSKGLLQTLQSAAGIFSGMVTVFCARLGWKNMELLLSQFQSRLSFGVEWSRTRTLRSREDIPGQRVPSEGTLQRWVPHSIWSCHYKPTSSGTLSEKLCPFQKFKS